jgi:hypothetical protein
MTTAGNTNVDSTGLITITTQSGIATSGYLDQTQALAPVASGCQTTSSAAAASGTNLGTNIRKQHASPLPLSNIRLTYGNVYNNAGVEADTLVTACTVTAAVEYPATVYTPVYFSGKRAVTIDPGGFIESDPVPISIPANTQFFTRTHQELPVYLVAVRDPRPCRQRVR